MGSRERKVVQEALRQVEGRRQRRRGESFLRWLVGFWVLLLLSFLLAPWWPLSDKVWAAAHGVCAQVDGHMLLFAGRPLPLCARDSGIYLGAVLGTAYLLLRRRRLAAGRPARWFWWAFSAIVGFFAVDVANSVADDWFHGGVYRPHNLLRMSSGMLLGMVTAVLLLWALNLSFSRRQVDRPILAHWGDLIGLLLLAVGGGLVLWSGWAALYVPLTVLSMSGMVGMLLAACFLWLLTRTRGRGLLENGWDAVPTLFWASLATVVAILALSWVRYRLGF